MTFEELLYFSFLSPLFFLFLFTSFIFDRGHITDLLRYVFFRNSYRHRSLFVRKTWCKIPLGDASFEIVILFFYIWFLKSWKPTRLLARLSHQHSTNSCQCFSIKNWWAAKEGRLSVFKVLMPLSDDKNPEDGAIWKPLHILVTKIWIL